MAWEWSFSVEGEANIRENISRLEKDELIVILAEYAANVNGDFDEDLYNRAIESHKNDQYIRQENLIEPVYQLASEVTRTCSNGGFEAWVCPFGCHTVSLDVDGELEYLV